MIEGLMFELAVTVLKATRYAAKTDIVSVPLTRWGTKNSRAAQTEEALLAPKYKIRVATHKQQNKLVTQSFLSLVDQVAVGPQVVAMVVVVVVEIMAEETLEVPQVKSQFLWSAPFLL